MKDGKMHYDDDEDFPSRIQNALREEVPGWDRIQDLGAFMPDYDPRD
jgi:hypothetical protein